MIDLSEYYLTQHCRLIHGIEIYYLVEYRNGLEERFIYSLKSANCHFSNFDWIASLVVEKMFLFGLNLKEVVWVTPVSRHSVEIVNSINKITGLNTPIIVLKELQQGGKIKKQKLKNKQERQSKAFQTPKGSALFQKSYVFIDDVVATGNTAKAAKIALGSPIRFQVWCLCYRPKLAQKDIV